MFLKMGQSRPLFVYFRYFLDAISIIQIEKSIDDVLGIRIRGRRMVGKEETTKLWRPPGIWKCCHACADRCTKFGIVMNTTVYHFGQYFSASPTSKETHMI